MEVYCAYIAKVLSEGVEMQLIATVIDLPHFVR